MLELGFVFVFEEGGGGMGAGRVASGREERIVLFGDGPCDLGVASSR